MKTIALSLVLASLLLAGCATVAAPARTVEVRLLAINDLHGRLEPPEGQDGQVGGVAAGGVEYLATHLKTEAAANPNTMVVAAGDLYGASPLFSAMFDDAPTIESVDAMGVMATALGNHELDEGAADLLKTTTGAKVRYLAANAARVGPPPGPLLPPMWIAEVGGVKIGFIGEILHDVGSVTAAKSLQGLAFFDEAKAANAAVQVLRRQGVRTVVLLIHEGGLQHPPGGGPGEPDGCEGFSGGIVPVVEKLNPAIKIVVSGHSHLPSNCLIKGRSVTNAGAYGRGYTIIDLTIDADSDRLVRFKAVNKTATRDVARDPAQTAILDKYHPRAAAVMNRPVGSIDGAMTRFANIAGESSIGDVIADAFLVTARDWAPNAQIAFTNSGGLRASLGAEGQSGPVTYAQLYAVQPFGNRLVAVTLTGEALQRLLEQQFKDGRRNILQVSKGFTYRYRQNAPDGQHVEPGSLRIDGRAVQPADKVRIIISDFLLGGAGGDATNALRQAADPVLGPVDLEAVVQYFTARSPIAPGAQDRIVRLDPVGPVDPD